MKKVYIVVEDGLVREVYSETEEVDIEIIDLDTDDGDLYESLYNELEKRGYGLIRHKAAGREHFIIMDDLDLIVETRASRTVLHIGFTFEFIDIFAVHTPASKVADYIGSLHQLLDEIGDEIDGIL